jgi:hypothetical protein
MPHKPEQIKRRKDWDDGEGEREVVIVGIEGQITGR